MLFWTLYFYYRFVTVLCILGDDGDPFKRRVAGIVYLKLQIQEIRPLCLPSLKMPVIVEMIPGLLVEPWPPSDTMAGSSE